MNSGRITKSPQVFVIADSQSVLAAKSTFKLVGTFTMLVSIVAPLVVKKGDAV